MHPERPSNPTRAESFNGLGMNLTIEMSDTRAVYERFKAAPALIAYPLADEDWGQRRFMVRDPAGVLVCLSKRHRPTETRTSNG